MIKAAVLGSPIAHSLSPLLHRRAYEILGIPASYEAILCDESDFPSFIERQEEAGWTGFSLTMPLKEIAIDYLTQVEPTSKRIDSINTMVKSGTGWFGVSTDRLAISNLLKSHTFSRVAIIGGGGTARAALGALDGLTSEIDILLRSPNRAQKLSACVTTSALNYFDMTHSVANYDLVIATVPAGASDSLVIKDGAVNGVLLEALYRPWPTKLAASWQGSGGYLISGLELLVEQALFQIELFSKSKFDFSEMRGELLQIGLHALA
jgi:shikimate dehydrogenase